MGAAFECEFEIHFPRIMDNVSDVLKKQTKTVKETVIPRPDLGISQVIKSTDPACIGP